jgi:tetratricopeptide (TPR) repeat protein
MDGLKALGQEDYPLAIQLLEKVIASDPENENLQRSLSIAYNEYGQLLFHYDPVTALENFQSARKLWPENPMVPDSLEQAQEMFAGSLRSDAMRESATPRIQAATIAYMTPSLSKRANQPTKPLVKPAAKILTETDHAKLQKESRSAVRGSRLFMPPTVIAVPSAQGDQNLYEATIRYNLGVKAEEAHDKLLAISYYKRACQFVPDFFSAHLRLGIIYHKQHDTFDALSQVKECLRITPTDERAKELLSLLTHK